MRRLSSLGSRQLAHRKGRSALTAIGIVLGVAILFGVLVTNATTQTGVDDLISDFAGNADVLVGPVGAFDATMPADTLDKIRTLPKVAAAAGSLSFRSSIRPDERHGIPGELGFDLSDVLAYGIDLRSAQRIQPYTLETGRLFGPGAPEMVVPRRLADKLKISTGNTYKVQTPFGLHPVRLVGVLTDTGAGRTNQGDVLFTSIQEAATLARKPGVISGARVVLDEGTDIKAWIEDNKAALGKNAEVLDASTLAQGFKDFLAVLGAMFTFFAAITLFVGAFLIYLTLAMAVIERTRIYGTMRALGSTRAQVRRVVIAEALALGTVSTIAGLGLGLLIAKGLLALVSQLFELDLPNLTVQSSAIIASIIVGMGVTTISSLIPARRASRLSPVVAMKGDYRTDTRLSRGWIAGVVASGVGVAIGLFGGSSGALGTPLLLLGSVLLVPLLLRPLAGVLGRITNRIARGVGDIAVLHLVKERSRSAYTLALVMVVMSMIFSIGGLYASLAQALDQSLDRQFGSDIQVDAPGQLGPEFESRLRAVPGVAEITSMRFAGVTLIDKDGEEQQGFARIIEPGSYFDISSFLFVEGTENAARRELGRGGVLIPVGQAEQQKLELGDEVTLVTSQGRRPFTLVGTFQSFGGPPETVVGLADGRRYFNAGAPSSFQLNVRDGASIPTVKKEIDAALGEDYNLEITSVDVIKSDAKKQFGQFFNIFYAIILVAAIVGLLGLANTLAMSVLQRYREIGILRAIGTTRPQIRRMVLVESSTLGLVAFALSLPLGLILSIVTLKGVSLAFGFDVAYVYPAGWVPIVAGFGILVAIVAAIAPGRRAAKLHVVGALQYE